jgi:hypothetical protein
MIIQIYFLYIWRNSHGKLSRNGFCCKVADA